MSPGLLNDLCEWSDVQNLIRRSTDADVAFKPAMAKHMLGVAIGLFRWFRTRQSAVRQLNLQLPMTSVTIDDALTSERLHASQVKGSLAREIESADNDLMEETDAGGEASDGEDEAIVAGAQHNHGVAPLDPDTENDEANVAADNANNALDDSDTDNNMDFHGM